MLEENQPDGNRCESPGRVARRHNTESTGTSKVSVFLSLFFLSSLHCNLSFFIYIYIIQTCISQASSQLC